MPTPILLALPSIPSETSMAQRTIWPAEALVWYGAMREGLVLSVERKKRRSVLLPSRAGRPTSVCTLFHPW